MNYFAAALYFDPVRPARFYLLPLLLLVALFAGHVLNAQISAEEQRKRELFLRARESIEPAPAPMSTPAPVRPQPRPRPTAPPVERSSEPIMLPPPRSTPAPTPAVRSTPKPAPPTKPQATPKPKATPRPASTPARLIEESPVITLPPPREQKTDEIKLPPARSLVTPSPAPTGTAKSEVPGAPIVIEKSGAEEDQGVLPAPPPERRGLFGWGGPRYRYLTREVRQAIDRAPVKRGRWQYIIIHNSGTRQGNAKIFNNYHKNVRRMENGLAYHFVIGNGTSSGNGEIEIGPRWTRQINGGHVASDYLNNISIGICFVGDFNRDKPTEAQLGALEELVRYLRNRVGRSKGRWAIVKAHREINPKPTDCPGNRFPYTWLRRKFD